MRNLKRALSLALASVMVLGMMVVGAGAASFDDFSDKDKIVNAEAVSTLVELNIIDGKDDGSYDPTGIITRAEMAKLICTVLNGGKDPNLGSNVVTTYADTATNWAAGYIEYCTTKGIVAGDGSGNFNPGNTVTGAEAAKMLLVAAGYQSAIEGYTGPAWANAVNVQANKVGLYDGLSIDPSQGLTRDSAAQMVFNALGVNVVTYKYTMVTNGQGSFTSIPELVETNSAGAKKTVLEEKFGVVTVEGIAVANEYADLENGGDALDKGETRINVKNHGEGQNTYTDGAQTFKVSSGADVLGRAVTLYVKPSTTAPNTATKGLVIGGVVVDLKNNVIVDAGPKSVSKVANDNKLNLNSDSAPKKTLYSYQYGQAVTDANTNFDASTDPYGNQTNFATMQGLWDGKTGITKTIIDNDEDNVVDYVIYSYSDFGKVTKYTTKDDGEITVTGLGSSPAMTILNDGNTVNKDDKDKVVGFDDVKKDDYVLFSVVGGKLYVEKAETVEGDLDAYKFRSGNTAGTLTVDGTKYTYAETFAYTDSAKLKDPKRAGIDFSLDNEAVFYMDKNGYVIAVGESTLSRSYAYVLAYNSATAGVDGDRVKVMLSDGTIASYNVNECRDAADANDKTPVAKTAYTYSITDDDDINLREIAGGQYDDKGVKDNSASAYTFAKGKATVNNGGSNLYADDATVFFYVNAAETKGDIYVGKDKAPSVNKASGQKNLVITDSSDSSLVKAVVLIDAQAVSAGDYLYLVKMLDTTSAGTTYVALIDGKLYDSDEPITVKSGDHGAGVYQYVVNSKGNYELSSMPANTYFTGVVTRDVIGGSVILDNGYTTHEYVLKNSTVSYLDGDKTDTNASISKGDIVTVVFETDKKEIENAYILANEDNTDNGLYGVTVTLEDDTAVLYPAIKSGTDFTITVPAGSNLTSNVTVDLVVNSGAAISGDFATTVHTTGVSFTDGVSQDIVVTADGTPETYTLTINIDT